MKKNTSVLSALAMLVVMACNNPEKKSGENNADAFLEEYNKKFQELSAASNKADWASNTKIVDGDSTNSVATRKAKEAYARFTGSAENTEKAQKFLAQKDRLSPLQIKQLEHILYFAGNNPQTQEAIVKERIKEETLQIENLFGFDFQLDGKSITTNAIDGLLKTETDAAKRQKIWECSKEVGKKLKPGLAKMRDLRNKTVQGLGYKDFFSYQVSDYGMTAEEMMDQLRKINAEIYPLYRELHTYARYELAKKYGVKTVPDMLPAHWLPNRWGQDWSEMVEVKGLDLDGAIKTQSKEWVVEQAERFYVSMGFPGLPESFYEKSDLYPLPADAAYKKNNHASAWHMDLDKDVRSLMSVEPNTEWYETTHHELGHIYYYICYSTPEIPIILREGANRAFHESLGSLMGFAAMQKPFLAGLNLLPSDAKSDTMKALLKEAMNYIVLLPWSAGTMSEFEYQLYSKNIPAEEFNKKWWEIVKEQQGIVPPADRGEEYCDAATKTHIIDDPAQYYDYALSFVLLFQVHDYIATNILHQDPHATNYYGNKEIGKFIGDIMKQGSTGDWKKLLKEKTGEDLSARAMLKYFSPLMDYMKKENEGRKYTLPEKNS